MSTNLETIFCDDSGESVVPLTVMTSDFFSMAESKHCAARATAFSRSLTGSRLTHDLELTSTVDDSGAEPAAAAGLPRITSGPILSTSFSTMTRLRSISRTELTSVSRDMETGIIWPVVAVGSSVTVSRPSLTSNFDSDLYFRGQN